MNRIVFRLEDKVAVVTGRGLGNRAEAAELLAMNGARLAVIDRDAADVEHVAKKCGGPPPSRAPGRDSR